MSHRNPTLAITFALIGLCFTATTSAAPTPDVIGQWSLVAPLPYFPVHANLLPNGKVMIWPGDLGISGNDPRSWDPADQSVTSLSKPGYDLFCVGHTSLADGTLFLAGGHISNFVGLSRATTYNYLTDTWSSLPDMNAGRWYPTTTVLANGDVLTISGDIDTTVGVNPLPQVLEVSKGTWRDLTSAQLIVNDYPRMFLAPNGKVFSAGDSPVTRYLDTSGTGAWSFVANRVDGFRDFGSAVMYAPGKILTMGGGTEPPLNTAEVIDLNQASPSWRAVASMQFARRQLNATLLPDGKVLVTGGTSSPGFNDPTGHVDAAELWDPATENWTTLASSTGIPRVYHSTALLLPDGRIFSTGGNGHPEVEIYSPPYLFKGVRPTISSAPSTVGYGESFLVNTPDAAAISKVTMLRIASVTHAFNMGQAIADLSFSQTTGGLNVVSPPSPNVAPPGYYMLFILNGSGVPSVAKFVKVNAGPAPLVSITAPDNGATVSGSSITVSANASDNVGVTGVQFKIDGTNLGAEDTAFPYAVTWDSTAVADGSHELTAVARNAAGYTTTSLPISVTVNNTTPLPPDLIVTQLSYANGIFTSIVKNQGGSATPAGVGIGVGYSVDGTFRTWGSVSGPLAAGASVTIGTKGVAYIIPNGTHTMTAWVDDVNRIAESNETNNEFALPVTGGTPDTQAPTVSMTAPADGSTISGSSVTLSASAADNVGIAGVQFQVSGSYAIAEDTTAPYAVTWDSTAVADGPHTITAVARDATGNTTTSPAVTVMVSNGGITDTQAPTVSMTAPDNGATVLGSSVTVSANASDNVSVAGVQFKLDGANNLGAEDTTSPYAVTWDSTAVADGTHTITAVARDAAGNTATSAGVAIAVSNTTPPSNPLPDVVVTQLSYANGIFTSTVKNQGTAATPAGVAIGVGYFVDGSWQTWGAVTGPLAAGASVTIGTKGGAYTIPTGTHTMTAYVDDVNRFAELDETNNQFSQSISDGGGTTDTQAPTVSMTAPADGATVSGSSVTVSASAADNVGVAGVQFKLDGANNLGGEDTTSPYAVTWNSTAVADGTHTITAVARDAAGNTTTSAGVTVTVSNGGTADTQVPTVSMTAPANGATVSGASVTVSASAADNVGVAGVQFKLDGANNLGAEDTTSPYAVTWNSTAVADGTHTITAVARDAAGNTATSAGVTVTVDNTTPPSNPLPDVIVTQLSYANGIFTSTVKNQGTAATPAGVAIGVGYFVDGSWQTWGAVTGPLAAGASVTIGTKGGAYTIPTGTHTMTAYVDDVNRFAELDETNNRLSQSVTVP